MTNPFLTPPPAPAPVAPPQAPPAAPNPFGAGVPVQQPAPNAAPPGYMVTSQVTMPPPQPAASPGGDPFGAPAPRADRPTMLCLPGRLLLIIPKRMEYQIPVRNPKPNMPTHQDRLTADVIVLDGGTLWYGGDPQARPPRPHTKTVEVPYRIEGMFISQVGLLSQARDEITKMQQGQIGMLLGRLGYGEASNGNNAPYLLQPFTEQDAALARQWLAANPVQPFGGAR